MPVCQCAKLLHRGVMYPCIPARIMLASNTYQTGVEHPSANKQTPLLIIAHAGQLPSLNRAQVPFPALLICKRSRPTLCFRNGFKQLIKTTSPKPGCSPKFLQPCQLEALVWACTSTKIKICNGEPNTGAPVDSSESGVC